MPITSINNIFISETFLVPHFLKIQNPPQRMETEIMEFAKFHPFELNCQEHTHFEFSHPHQIVFTKNFELLKNKYQRRMSPNLEIDLWKQLYISVGQTSFFEKMCEFKKKL